MLVRLLIIIYIGIVYLNIKDLVNGFGEIILRSIRCVFYEDNKGVVFDGLWEIWKVS